MFITSEYSSLQNAPPLKLFLPSECSFPKMFLPSECSFLQNIPPYRILPPSNCYSLQKRLPSKLLSIVSLFRRFLTSECSAFQNFPFFGTIPSEFFSFESAPPLRMFLPWKQSSRQNVSHLKVSPPQNVPPLKVFLPSVCSSLESVPPLRMLLHSECSSNKNIPHPPLHVPLLEVHIWNTSCVCMVVRAPLYLSRNRHMLQILGKVRIVHSAQCGGITEAKFLVPACGM